MGPNVTSQSPGEAIAGTLSQTDKIDPLFRVFSEGTTLPQFFEAIFFTAIAVGATLAVLRLGYAGFLYMGDDIWSHKSDAKKIMTDVVVGILLLLSIWVILKQINPELLNLNILRNAKPLQNTSTQQTVPTPAPAGPPVAPGTPTASAPKGSWCSDVGNQCYSTLDECDGIWPFKIACSQKQ